MPENSYRERCRSVVTKLKKDFDLSNEDIRRGFDWPPSSKNRIGRILEGRAGVRSLPQREDWITFLRGIVNSEAGFASPTATADYVEEIWRALGFPELTFDARNSIFPNETRGGSSAARLSPPFDLESPDHIPLLGRERDLDLVLAAIDRSFVRVVLITGTTGVGKTRLGLEAWSRLQGRFDRDRAWIALEFPETGGDLPARLVADLGITTKSGDDALTSLIQYLRDRPYLLVLDNFEQWDQAAEVVVKQLAAQCPNLKMIITSQRKLDLERTTSQIVELKPLEVTPFVPGLTIEELANDASYQLFRLTAEAMGAPPIQDVEIPDVLVIIDLVEGLPLAVQLMAAWTETYAPAHIRGLLESSQYLPRMEGRRRHDLQAAVRWSYGLVSDERQRAVLGRLAFFDGPFPVSAAGQRCRGPEQLTAEAVVTCINELRARCFVQAVDVDHQRGRRRETYCRLLRVIREQLRELDRTRRSEHDAFKADHLAYYLERARFLDSQLWTSDEATALATLDLDQPNIRSALNAAKVGGAEATLLGLDLAGTLWRYWWIRHRFREGQEWLEMMLSLNPTAPDQVRCRALCGAGTMASALGEFKRGRASLQASIELAERCGDKLTQAIAHNRIGVPLADSGEWELAINHYEQSISLFQQLDHPFGIAWSEGSIGHPKRHVRNYGEAMEHFKRSLFGFEGLGIVSGAESASGQLGRLFWDLWWDQSEPRDPSLLNLAVGYLQLSAKRLGELDDQQGIWSLAVLGRVLFHQNDLQGAALYSRRAIELEVRDGGVWSSLFSAETAGMVGNKLGVRDDVVRLLGAVDTLREARDTPRSPADNDKYAPQKELICAGAREIYELGTTMTWNCAMQLALRVLDHALESIGGPQASSDTRA